MIDKSVVSEEAEQVEVNSTGINKKLKNAYLLMGAMLVISTISAWVVIALGNPMTLMLHPIISLVVSIALIMAIEYNKNSIWGLLYSAIFSVVLGSILAPMLAAVISINPASIVIALGGTAIIFIGATLFALSTKKSFAQYDNYLLAALVAVIVMQLAGYWVDISAFTTLISSAVILIMVGFIIIETQQGARDPNSSYISLALGMYLSIINIFQSLLSILNHE